MSTLHLENVSLYYGKVRGIENVSQTFRSGLTTVIGPSGSGKTSFFRCVAGLETPSSGTIDCNTKRLNEHGRLLVAPPKRDIMLVSQDPSLWPHLNARENITAVLRGRGLTRKTADAEALTLLDQMGAEHLATRRPQELSGGQARCVEIARALAVDASVLLLDEPFTGIDVQASYDILDRIRSLLDESDKIVILSTHSPTLLRRLNTNTLLFDSGRVVTTGPFADMQNEVDPSFLKHLQDPSRPPSPQDVANGTP